jgi:hypothetical protein
VWSAFYHKILYFRRAKSKDFVRFYAPAVVYKYAQTSLSSFQNVLFYLAGAACIPLAENPCPHSATIP